MSVYELDRKVALNYLKQGQKIQASAIQFNLIEEYFDEWSEEIMYSQHEFGEAVNSAITTTDQLKSFEDSHPNYDWVIRFTIDF